MESFFGIYYTTDELIDYIVNLRHYSNLILCICCLASLIISYFVIIRKKKQSFAKIMLLGILCEMLRCWFVVSSFWAADIPPSGYNTSTLAHLGVFIFMSLQSITMPKTKVSKKGRLITALVPALALFPIVGTIVSKSADATVIQKIIAVIFFLMIANCIAVSMRYIVAENDENNICGMFRKTNIIIVVYAFATIMESFLLLVVSYTKPDVIVHIGIMFSFLLEMASVLALPIVTAKEVD